MKDWLTEVVEQLCYFELMNFRQLLCFLTVLHKYPFVGGYRRKAPRRFNNEKSTKNENSILQTQYPTDNLSIFKFMHKRRRSPQLVGRLERRNRRENSVYKPYRKR
ncbi:hypothetical protein [Runella slithyformis]|uniref:hypothetical protein n=1 Tax=Runella slithyformis TaxID=106 RepID=UPI00146A09D2|nr:hypothetical protein [Runella slithyformis]